MLLRKLNAFIVMCVLCVLSLRVVVQVPWLPRQQIRIDHEHCSVWEEVPFGRPLIAPLLSNTILWIWKLALKIVQIFFLFQSEWRFIKNYWSHVSSGSCSVASDLAERILRWDPM